MIMNQEAYTLSFYKGVVDSLAIELRASKIFTKLIREKAAEEACLALVCNQTLVTKDKIERVKDVITTPCWEAGMELTQSQKLELCEFAGLEHGVMFRPINRTVTRICMHCPQDDFEYHVVT